jgi:2-polyprenyl-6-methoxyphenol hydroxylase-like FAD-dependent oxidoreductase
MSSTGLDKPQIVIVGAGIAGSLLASVLRRRKIPTVIIDKAVPAPPLTYSCSLQKRTQETLKAALELYDDDLAASTRYEATASTTSYPGDLHVHRGGLGESLRGLCPPIIHAEASSVTLNPLAISLSNGQVMHPELLVAADGPHSSIRSLLGVSRPLTPLPFVVIRGTRRYPGRVPFEVPTKTLNIGRTRLAASAVKSTCGEGYTLSYTYSRPSTGDGDPVHSPSRSLSDARSIHPAFYQEIAALPTLPSPFDQIFAIEAMKQDRLLHWVMRSGLVPLSTITELARSNVLLIGDAVHPMPILGGTGLNVAVDDAAELANIIADGQELANFYSSRYEEWRRAVSSAEKAICDMHSST